MNTTLPIEVAPQLSRDAGFTGRVTITAAAWNDTIAWDDVDGARTGALQDEVGRLMDVLRMAATTVREAQRANAGGLIAGPFTVYRIPRGVPYLGDDDEDGSYEELMPVDMYVIAAGSAVTISLPEED